MKLDTAEQILEWAQEVNSERTEMTGRFEFALDDTATAERLAYCVRVTAIVEREAQDEDGWLQPDCIDILAEAEKGERK